jgi:hypothetical protein
MRRVLDRRFDVTITTADRMEEGQLAHVDLIILCTTEGAELDDCEHRELQRFVHAGGTAILSAFANWSAHDHYNKRLTDWLGITVTPHAHFCPPATHELTAECSKLVSDAEQNPEVDALLSGPWGTVRELRNEGETQFQLAADGAAGGLVLGLDPLSQPVLAFFPRLLTPKSSHRTAEQDAPRAGARRQGQVLVLSNLHCFADANAWNGGLWRHDPNQRLLFNLISSALAWRLSPSASVPS